MYIGPKYIKLLTDFEQINNFSKQVANGLDDIVIKALAEYGFSKEYIEKNNSEFHMETWPSEDDGFGTEEYSTIKQYDIYHLDEKLFTIDVIVRAIHEAGDYRLEVQYEARKWKEIIIND